MKKLSCIVQKNIRAKRVGLFFFLTNVVYMLMLFITIPQVMIHSSGLKLLDMMPMGYTTEYAKSLFDTLGPEGREAYLYNQIPVDMIYPFLFGVSYCLVLVYFLNKLNNLKTPFLYLCFLPLIAGIADYLENFGIISLLNNYPDISSTIVSLTNSFSLIKSSATTLCFVVLLISLTLLGIRALKKVRNSI